MLRIFILVVFIFNLTFADDRLIKAQEMALNYAKENFKDVEIINVLKITKSYENNLKDDFDEVECKSKGKSSLYLYLDCKFFKNSQEVGEIPITFRIKESTKHTIEKNQKVKIVYINKNIKIELLGISLENGKEGDYIKVKNISTGKEIIGKVISGDTVLIEGEL